MATTYSGSINLQLLGQMSKTLDIGSARLDVNYSKKYGIANGTSAAEANMIWTDTRTVNASSSEDLDLYGGLINAFGDTINFTAIKGVFIFASADNVNNIQIGGDANALVNWVGNANDLVVIKPGGMFAIYDPSAAGYGVTNSTGDILQIANADGGSSVDYDIIVIGEV